MEFILHNADIFDKEINVKFNQLLEKKRDSFVHGDVYKLTVSFHVDLLKDNRFDEFDIPIPSKTNKGTRKDKIYDVMRFQLKSLEQILDEAGVEVCSSTIQGDCLQEENLIKIEIIKDIYKEKLTGRGKNKKRSKVSSIVPSLPYTRETINKLASERLSKLFFYLLDAIQDKTILSKILDIDQTEDDSILFSEFCKQYGELWLTTKEREKELLDQLRDKSISIVNEYLGKENAE